MRNIFIIICCLLFGVAYSQEQKVYIFYVELSNLSLAPKFKTDTNRIIYDGTDNEEKAFFSKYTMLDFFQAFPDSKRQRTLNMFMVATYSDKLMQDMLSQFPRKYVRVEDVSDVKVELAESYPNDYGTTSPITNSGIQGHLKNFDYINVPKAWDYTFGDPDIRIGISDTKIDTTDIDFKYKTDFLPGYGNLNSSVYSPTDGTPYHGTGVAGVAAAQGNNGHALSGVCSDCGITATSYTYGSPGTYTNPNPALNKLLQLAISGVKVINMSWRYGRWAPITTEQWIFDEIHEDYDVVLVAGAGNENPNDLDYITYPASYNHVISVTTVNNKNEWNEETDPDATYGQISKYVKDQIAPKVANYNGSIIGWPVHTINKDVDICAPGYFFRYSAYVGEGAILYGYATSGATPHVSGTIGLMFSVNDCLISDEVEDILQLCSKNLEIIPGNEPYAGRIGSGKLETGDAVQFVYEMKQPNGNAIIDGQDFYRFNFNLKHVNNKLTISNQKFRDACVAEFTAKNSIEILPGSDFNPNNSGLVDLKINSNIDVTCATSTFRKAMTDNSENKIIHNETTKLYPNPNNGTFDIILGKQISGNIDVEVYDISGKVIYRDIKQGAAFNISVPNIMSGMYIVRLSSGNYKETIKFVKN